MRSGEGRGKEREGGGGEGGGLRYSAGNGLFHCRCQQIDWKPSSTRDFFVIDRKVSGLRSKCDAGDVVVEEIVT